LFKILFWVAYSLSCFLQSRYCNFISKELPYFFTSLCNLRHYREAYRQNERLNYD
jgi:hypothetical protein